VGAVISDPRRADRGTAASVAVLIGLLAVAAGGWWVAASMADDMGSSTAPGMRGMDGMAAEHTMSLAAFILGWVAMMAAMMLPAIVPVVKLYARAAAQGRVAPLPLFVGGYLTAWGVLGLPAYMAWRWLADPLSAGEPWVGRLAGGALLLAAAWQLSPLKSLCLRHCRSPMSFFMRHGSGADRPLGAVRLGATHGAFCVGCCWALMVVLVAFGTMDLRWMAALALLIFLEKDSRHGEGLARIAAAIFVAGAAVLLLDPETITTLT
jgi:predicted metal-binding membrane protein